MAQLPPFNLVSALSTPAQVSSVQKLLGSRSRFNRRSNISWRGLGGFMQTLPSPAYDGRTYQTIFSTEAGWQAIRLIIRNNGTAYTLNSCAVSATNGVFTNPSPANWFSVTFNSSTSVTIPAALGTNRPSITVSDWIYFPSVARNDGGLGVLLCARAYYATGPASGYGNTSNPTQTGNIWSQGGTGNSYNLGRPIQILGAPGDFVSSNQAGFSSASPNPNYGMLLAEAEFMHVGNIMTVAALGDSITQGDTSTYNLLGPVHVACATVSTSTNPVVAVNQGFSSQTTTNFLARLKDLIASGRAPSVCVYSAYSPNDVSTNDTTIMTNALALMRQNLAQALTAMRAANIVPIISTGLPYAYSSSVDALRIGFNNEIRALASQGIDVADYDLQLSNGATPAVIQYPNYTAANQNLHPSDGGYQAMGTLVLVPILSRLAVEYFAP